MFLPRSSDLGWEQWELLLPCSLSPPGTITASNRSDRSSISMGSRTSDSQNWHLISNSANFILTTLIITSSLFQLTNLWPTLHITEKLSSHIFGLPPCLSFPLLSFTWRFYFNVSDFQLFSLISVSFIFITLGKLPCYVKRLFHLPNPLFPHLWNKRVILDNCSASILF